MTKTYVWRIAQQNDFHRIYALIFNSEYRQKWGVDEIRRRVIIPLFLEQLIVFYTPYEDGKLCGFLTYALMDGDSACHQSSVGVLPFDWRSGKQLWVVDFMATNGDGRKMFATLRNDVKCAIAEPLRYFRAKYNKISRMAA